MKLQSLSASEVVLELINPATKFLGLAKSLAYLSKNTFLD
jgi:hypothetical protein